MQSTGRCQSKMTKLLREQETGGYGAIQSSSKKKSWIWDPERNPLVRQIFTTHAKSLRHAFMNEASAFLIPVGVSPPSYFREINYFTIHRFHGILFFPVT